MERLTEYIDDSPGIDTRKLQFYCDVGGYIVGDIARRLAAYEDTGLEPEEIITGEELAEIACALAQNLKYSALGTIDELSALAKAQAEGRAVVLPCKPSGVTVYQLRGKKHALGVGVSPRHISCATVWADGGYALHHQGADDCLKKDFGKTWFLDRAEAEAALQEGGHHETDPV